MTYADAISRLRAHASKVQVGADDTVPCLGLEIFHFRRGKTSLAKLCRAVNDVIRCLAVVNRAVNGNVPSQSRNPTQQLPRELIDAVSLILHEGWLTAISDPVHFTGSDSRELFAFLWAVSHAWVSILAGDIDDVYENLRHECIARGLSFELEQDSGDPV